LHFVFP